MTLELRYDNGRLSKAKKTSQGFLKIPANLTRTGVLPYTRADGSVQYELRHPDEVFHPDSLASLSLAPVTDLHPSEMVTPDNVKSLMVGMGSETPKKDGIFVSCDLTITDADEIKAVERGDRSEVSLGYRCKMDMTPGVWEGQRYDARQTQIRYNHIAIGPKGWGRAGSQVALRLDGSEATSQFDGAVSDVTQESRKDNHLEEIEIKLDGVTVKVPKLAKELFDKELARLDSEKAALNGKLGTAEARATAAETQVKDLQGKLDTAQDPKTVQAKVDARLTLETSARKVLGDEKLDGLTERQIQEKVILKALPETKLDGKSADYIQGVFEFATSKAPDVSLGNARQDGEDARGADHTDAKKAREDANKRKAQGYSPIKGDK